MAQDYQQMMEQFEKVKDLDSMAFVEIPQREIVEPWRYRQWLVEEVEMKWMREFNQGNENYLAYDADFNRESGIQGYFGGVYIMYSKFYRFDGTEPAYSNDDFRAKRGLLIRDHYDKMDVVKVQHITDNLVEFLKQERIEHNRRDFKRRV